MNESTSPYTTNHSKKMEKSQQINSRVLTKHNSSLIQPKKPSSLVYSKNVVNSNPLSTFKTISNLSKKNQAIKKRKSNQTK